MASYVTRRNLIKWTEIIRSQGLEIYRNPKEWTPFYAYSSGEATSDVTDSFSGMAEGGRHLGIAGSSDLEKRESRTETLLHPPCEGQADKWLTSARELYFSILEQADEVVYVSREYHKGCMLERNRYPVNHAACLLADFIHTRACKLICEEFLTRPALRPAVNRFRKIEAIIQPIPGWLNE